MLNMLFSLRKSVSDLCFWFTPQFACCLETITILLARQRSRQVCADAYFDLHFCFSHSHACFCIENRDILLVRQRSACADAYLMLFCFSHILDVPAAKSTLISLRCADAYLTCAF